jgi:predicted ATPase/DNA-binding SARP family transcriptional activator
MTVEVRVLGPVTVVIDEVEIDLGGRRQRQVVALLAANIGEVVSPDRLVDALWGDGAPTNGRNTVQVAVSRVRQRLGGDTIVTSPSGYRLDDAVAVDAQRFQACIRSGERLVDRDQSAALAATSEAIELWHGEAYADMSEIDALATERARLDQLHVRCLEIRIDALLGLGRHVEAVAESETFVTDHPYHERFRAQHMLALYRSGRQADALRSYQRARQILADELGIDPSPELVELEGKMLAQDPTLAPSPRTAIAAAVSTLPSARSSLIGRDPELDELRGLLNESRLVTITGVGGCGKTSLAIALGHQEAHRFDNGTFFVDLTSASTNDQVELAIVAGIGLALGGKQRLMDQVVEFLAPRSCLLLVDNCEQVLDGVADALDELLTRCADLTVVATSRESISIEGERAWRIPSLAGGGIDSPAARLFVERARDADSGFVVGDCDADTIADIVEQLDGVPLAIELAAARSRSMTLDEISRRLDDRFALLSGGRRRRPARQQTLAGAVEWSHDLLDDDERTMLRRLAVFQGGFDLGDVGAVTGFDDHRAIDLVDALVAKSLVDVTRDINGAVRHRLLETIRLFAVEQLMAAGEDTERRDAHYEVFVGELRGTTEIGNAYFPHLVARNEQEIQNRFAAVEWGRRTGRDAEAAVTVARLTSLLQSRGAMDRYAELFDADYELPPAERATVLWAQVVGTWERRDYERGRAVIEQLRAIVSTEPIDEVLAAEGWVAAMHSTTEADDVLARLDTALRGAGGLRTPEAITSFIETHRAGALFSLGRLEEALEAVRRSHDLRRHGVVYYPTILALVALQMCLGFDDEARTFTQSRLEWDYVGDRYIDEICVALAHVGAGDPMTAGANLASAASRWNTGLVQFTEGDFITLFAAYRYELGDSDRAEALLANSQPRCGHLQWFVWPYVWGWTREDWVERNAEARERELEGLRDTRAVRAAMPGLLAEEVAFFGR